VNFKTFRRIGSLAVAIAVSSTLMTTDALASPQKGRVPGKPKVLVVEGIFRSRNFVDVRVTIKLPSVSSRNRITGSEVSLGKRKCKIRRSGTSCTIKKVRHSIVSENITARSKTSAGFGKSSARVRFMPTTTRWIRSGYSSTGVRFPRQSRATSNTRVLPNSSNERWAKFQAFGNPSVSARSASRVSSSSSNQATISFVTDGVIGLALPNGNIMQSGSGLYAVRSDGTTIDAVRNGSAQIRDFYTAPNNRFYVVFNGPTEIVAGSPLCVLAEVDEFSGNPRCVDEKLSSVNSDSISGSRWSTHLNPSIQFDELGNIYYSGNVYVNDGVCYQSGQCPSMSWPQKLRKSTSTGVRDLMSDYVQNSDYMVLGDGTVLISGVTSTTQVAWTRRISTSGVVSSIVPTQGATFLKRFADGNVYFGISSSVKRYITSTATLDPKDWLSSMYMAGNGSESPYFSTSSFCGTDIALWGSICQGGVSTIKYSFNIANSRTFVVNGSLGGSGMSSKLVQYFPTPERTNISLANITVAAQAGDKIVLAGTNAQGVNSLVVYDPLTFQETVLIDASNEIEVYSMSYVRSTGKLMFNGLVFATNRYVMGEVTIP